MKIQNHLNNVKILFIVLLSAFCVQANAQVDSADFKMRIDSLMNQGKIKFNNGKFQEALLDYTYVANMDVANVNAILQQGFCNTILKKYTEAIGNFTDVIFYEPNHEWAYVS